MLVLEASEQPTSLSRLGIWFPFMVYKQSFILVKSKQTEVKS